MTAKKLNTCITGFVIALTATMSANAEIDTQNAKRNRASYESNSPKKQHRLANPRNSPSAYNSLKAEVQQPELRRWEFRTAPVALLARWYTLDVSYRFTENFAVGPSIVIYDAPGEQGNMLAPTYKGDAFGFHANYYFTSVKARGWYSGLHAYQESYRSYPEGYPGYEDRKGYRSNITAGYQFKWSQVNLLTGLGMEYRNHNVVETSRYSGVQPETRKSGWGPTVEIKLGFEI